MKAASNGTQFYGEVVEWFIASLLKSEGVSKPPGVRIPPSPPFLKIKCGSNIFY